VSRSAHRSARGEHHRRVVTLPLREHRPGHGSVRHEVGRAGVQIAAQARSGAAIVSSMHRHPVALIVLVAWIAGIAGDAWTTTAMINASSFEEANPFAAHGMAWLGVGGWVAVASLVCALLAVISVGRAEGIYARTLLVACLLIGAVKVYTALANYLLWTSSPS
jgi:hypothetical protein